MSEPRTRFHVGLREGGKRLDRFLHERIPGLSRARIQRAIGARVGASWCSELRPASRVKAGGEVWIVPTVVPEEPLAITIPILARGAGWLAVDKPAGIPVHPVNGVRDNSLIRLLRRQERCDALRLVHRLDRETSGVLLVAEQTGTARVLARGFARGAVHKEYLALVAGVVAGQAGLVELPIGDAPDSRVHVRRAVGVGQIAATAWHVVRRFDSSTLLRVVPRTGRRHQIRVHLAALGHPILGDLLYGRPDADYLDLVHHGHDVRRSEGGPRRQLLHGARVAFGDAAAGLELDVTAPLPEDFRDSYRNAIAGTAIALPDQFR